ncbi:hypothetical protein G9A89_007073 [Geosiphon pyriformis]|nr:hypothetical protein G9A89_007073 [Geosiphon pyriformis]
MKHTPFDLTYGKTAILPINFTVETYSMQSINEENFQETLQRRAYTFFSTLKRKKHIAATHIEHSQALQKEKHDNKLPSVTNEFKDGPFYIHEILGNRSYKLRLDDKVLAKVAHRNRLKHYYSRNNSEPLIPQIVNNSQNYHSYRKKTRDYSKIQLPELLKQALKKNLLFAPIDIPPNATIQQKLLLFLNKQNNKHTLIYKYFHIGKTLYEQKLELEATHITLEAI